MKTAIGHPPVYFTVYKKQPSQPSPSSPFFKVVGAYSDIRDAIQAIATNYRRSGGDYSIESSTTKPKHWLHSSRYRN